MTDYLQPTNSFPGIAGSTGTRVDSASKHIMACKVNSNMLAQWCANQSESMSHMHAQKMKYCINRDELVLNVGLPLNEGCSLLKTGNAYPSVVSTLGDMTDTTQSVLRVLYHYSHTGKDFIQVKDWIHSLSKNQDFLKKVFDTVKSNDWNRIELEIKNLPFFMAQGYSLGIAYASALSGDTVSSVLIGGMCTVMNGAFGCRAGQMLHWYFDFERSSFHQENESVQVMGQIVNVIAGMRRETVAFAQLQNAADFKPKLNILQKQVGHDSASEKAREEFHLRSLGANDSYPKGVSHRKGLVAFPKPYLLTANGEDHYGDKIRIFAKCISGARKHEMMDIMLMTQSL